MQITKRVHAVRIPFQIDLPAGGSLERFVYVFLIYGDKIYLVDSGVASGEKMIFDYIKKTGRDPKDISSIILTHSHPDHIGSAKGIKDSTGCGIAAHPAEKDWIEDVELQLRQRPVPGFQSLVQGSVKVDRILNDGDTLSLEQGIELQVLHTPGHSRGSISLLLREDMAIFSGDCVFVPGDMPIYDNFPLAVSSLNKLKSIAGARFLLSAWDDPRQDGAIYETLDKGLVYLQRIHDVVTDIARGEPAIDPMTLCKKVVFRLNLPIAAVNPLVARSFQSHLEGFGVNGCRQEFFR